MRLLLDTRLLMLAAAAPDRLPAEVRSLIEAPKNLVCFSAASIAEVVAKQGLEREDFRVDAARLYGALLENGYHELPIRGAHALAARSLPLIHADSFDRFLIAQAAVEGVTFLTMDETVARYPGPIRKVTADS